MLLSLRLGRVSARLRHAGEHFRRGFGCELKLDTKTPSPKGVFFVRPIGFFDLGQESKKNDDFQAKKLVSRTYKRIMFIVKF